MTSPTYVKINKQYVRLNSNGLPRKRSFSENDIGIIFRRVDGKEYILKKSEKTIGKLVWKHRKANSKKKIKVRMTKEESNQRALDKMSQELSQLLKNVTEIRKRGKKEGEKELVKFY